MAGSSSLASLERGRRSRLGSKGPGLGRSLRKIRVGTTGGVELLLGCLAAGLVWSVKYQEFCSAPSFARIFASSFA